MVYLTINSFNWFGSFFIHIFLHISIFEKFLKNFYSWYRFVVKQKICCFFNSFFISYQLKGIVLVRSSYCKFSKFWLIRKSKRSQKLLLEKYPWKAIAKTDICENYSSRTTVFFFVFCFFWICKNQPSPKLTPLSFLQICSI